MTPDPLSPWRAFTTARIALGRAGASLTTRDRLAFQLDLARARDAVYAPFDPAGFATELSSLPLPALVLSTNAPDRRTYLQRPDLGRSLSAASRLKLAGLPGQGACDLVILLSDGLSPLALQRHAEPLLSDLLPKLLLAGWRMAPLLMLANARVAVQDEVGGLLNATLSLILLGERPGLGSPDSLGAYFTYQPKPGRTDADRNCLSNIRPAGLAPTLAAAKLLQLLTAARQRQFSGVQLKDEPAALPSGFGTPLLPPPHE